MFASKKHLICVYSNAQKDRKVQSHENSDKSFSFFLGRFYKSSPKKELQPSARRPKRVLGPTVVEAHWHDGARASVPDGQIGGNKLGLLGFFVQWIDVLWKNKKRFLSLWKNNFLQFFAVNPGRVFMWLWMRLPPLPSVV